MSQEESKFIRQLKITLISVLGPLIITGLILTGVNLHRIETNERHIKALESSKVSREIMLLYFNDLREMQTVMMNKADDQCNTAKEQIAVINDRLDQIMKDIYEVKKRGFPDGFKLDYTKN